jgi:competence protein ComEC
MIFYFLLFLIFFFNIILLYNQYKSFKSEEVYVDDFLVLNVYKKSNYNIIKIKNNHLTCFTKVDKNTHLQYLSKINIYLITKNISFIEYLKGFYTNSFNLDILQYQQDSFKTNIMDFIHKQHNNSQISTLYQALFLATPISTELRDKFSGYGISHLVAISGFHLGVISGILYFLFKLLYSAIHQKYLPYRNKRFDILIVVSVLLFTYLIFIDISASFLRSFLMFIIGIIFLRANIKVLSFETLIVITSIILAFYPKMIFSLSLWLSVSGVFYIFLFLKYFKNLPKYISFILFNFWIFFAINPIIHFIFYTTSHIQLLSPLLTILFTIFYPFELFAHLIGYGYLLDNILLDMIDYNYTVYLKDISLELFISYIVISLVATRSKTGFYILNIIMILFNIYFFTV